MSAKDSGERLEKIIVVNSQKDNYSVIEASHHTLGERWLYCKSHDGLLFTENETNTELLFGQKNASPYVKDGINNYVVKGDKNAVNPNNIGTKFAAHYQLSIPPGESRSIKLRLCNFDSLQHPFAEFGDIFEQRKKEADEFYHWINPQEMSEDQRRVQRQAFAGMLWSKQFYYYVIEDWLQGDPDTVPPPKSRKNGRNSEWKHLFIDNRLDLKKNVACMVTEGMGATRLLALCYATPRNDGKPNKLQRLLSYMLDEAEFLSPYGIRSVSKYHQRNPFVMHVNGTEYRVEYQPAESTSGMFGGNSNWRGPVWFPINYLLLEALQNFHKYLGDDFKVEFPTGSGNYKNLNEIIVELSGRMTNIFLRDESGKRPVFGGIEKFQNDPHWRDYIYFHEYFHGDNGAGLGASHQTGWTGVVAYLIQLCTESNIKSEG